uniref:Amiloride-sensitive sodium channel subunit gamma n=1 Tax=Strongyloides venezuelensis TaxID=75913 RepID=A0A0K0FLV1_STRVS
MASENVNVPAVKSTFKQKVFSFFGYNKEIIKEWAENSSIHGIPHAVAAKSTLATLIWIIIFIVCFIIFLVLFLKSLFEYLSFPTIVTLESRDDEMDFPAVTFCHSSPYSLKKIQNSQYKSLANVIQAYNLLNN